MAKPDPIDPPMRLVERVVEFHPYSGTKIVWAISGCVDSSLTTRTEWRLIDTAAGRQAEARRIIERLAAGHGGSVTWGGCMTDEAMAELRRVCSGDRLPKDWRDGVVPPRPRPRVEYEGDPIGKHDNDTGRGLGTTRVDTGQRSPIGSPNCDIVVPRPMAWSEILELASLIGAVALVFALAALVALS